MIALKEALEWVNSQAQRIPGEKLLLLYLINTMQGQPERGVQVTAKRMGEALEVSTRCVQRLASKLQTRGILRISRTSSGDGRITANIYYLPDWASRKAKK